MRANRASGIEHSEEPRWRAEKQMWANAKNSLSSKIVDFLMCPSNTMEQKKDILLHIPHSSTAFPEGSGYTFNDLNDEERLLIDYYTDELFAPLHASEQICDNVFPYCRLYCDVERLINDPLEKEGLGISYRRFTGGLPQKLR